MKLKKILVPVDFSRHSLAALSYAIDLGQEQRAEIILVHVVEPLAYGMGRWTEPVKLLESWQAEASAELQRIEQQARQRYPKCRGEIHFGNVHQVLSDLARKLKADLIVVSTHGRTGLGHMVMGSVAEKIVRYAPCPVLIVRAKLAPARKQTRAAKPRGTGKPAAASRRSG
jgi:universal stress protein A